MLGVMSINGDVNYIDGPVSNYIDIVGSVILKRVYFETSLVALSSMLLFFHFILLSNIKIINSKLSPILLTVSDYKFYRSAIIETASFWLKVPNFPNIFCTTEGFIVHSLLINTIYGHNRSE